MITYPFRFNVRQYWSNFNNVEENINEDGVVELKLNLAQEDKGRIIGRKGQVARSIRSILRVGAVKRNQVIRLSID